MSKAATQPHLVVLTGAGCSADSGLATFRDHNGLWEGHRVQDVATPEAWHEDPHTVWRFYQLRRAQLLETTPNAAHRALASLASTLKEAGMGMTLISQNVDDLHLRAGSEVIAMHGELVKLRCSSCGYVVHDQEHLDPEQFVCCERCGDPRLRPHIVWFGEIPLGMDQIDAAMQCCTHFAAVGTSGVVYPAAGLLATARRQGARTWVNSLDEPDNLHAQDCFVPGNAAQVLPRMLHEIAADMGVTSLSSPNPC